MPVACKNSPHNHRGGRSKRHSVSTSCSIAVDHVIYAYSITDISGMKISGHSDGGECAASKLLTNLIEETGLTNVFPSVTRKHHGPNLGQRRFALITGIGNRALDMVNNIDP